MPAAAVLFDMDGLLVDSEPVWTVAEEDLAARLGGTWSDELKATLVGTRLDSAVPRILEWYAAPAGPSDVAAAAGFLLERMAELFRERLPLLPGAVELVDGVRALGARTALVSSSYRQLVDAVLVQLDGATRFDVTVTGDEIERGKPDPQPYLRACELLGVAPGRCVVVEDAPSGVTSGEAAGCRVLAVPGLAPVPEAPGRWVVPSLAGIDPARVLAMVDEQPSGRMHS